ncbi:MAG TPA: ABC transporter permease [Terriglobales bacterium]|jgi:predicted permease|nr:ABC transporter permease [Terriglobales bacterium]
MSGLLQDLRYALRQLRKSPGFAITALISLTLGIGATTAIFSVVYSILLDPYPYRDADRMVHVELRDKSDRGPLLFVNGSEYEQLRQASSVDDIFLQSQAQQILTGGQFPISIRAGRYSPNLFTYMGVPPYLGRVFTTADAPGGKGAPVVLLSYLFWQKQFGGNRNVIGQTIEISHQSYTIIGVAAPRFTWGDSDVYAPGMPSGDPHDYWMSFIKLKPGVKHAAAGAEFQVLLDRFTKDDPKDFRRDRRVAIVTLNEEVLGRFSGTLVMLFAAVMALLVIGCANVSILLLARGIARQHELAVRASIGASRSRLIRQLLTESVLLSVGGAGLGVLVAYVGVGTLSSMLPLYSFPHEAAIRVNGTVLTFTAILSVLTGILFGISPAWQVSHPAISELIQANSTKHSGSARSRNTHRLLIAGQVSLTLLLMASAGAATKAFLALTHTPLGFDPDKVFVINTVLPKGASTNWQARLNSNEEIRRAIGEVPGVTSASISTTWFPPFGGFDATVEIRSKPTLTGAGAILALVSPKEFETLRIPLLAGRIFDDAELNRAAHLALVNQAFVKQFLPEGNPIGQSVRSPMLKIDQPDFLQAQAPDDWLEIIGVVGDARDDGLDHPVKPAVFLPYSFVLPPDVAVLARANGNPEAAILAVKQRLRQLNPELAVSQDHTLAWWLETQGWGQGRFIATLFSLFALLALALAAAGLYSVVSFSVTQRTQEVGIRMALGAPRTNILRLVISSTAAMLATGVAVGLVLSLALDRIVRAWAGGSPRDPLTLLGSAVILLMVATIACIVPAWRAATVNPVVALRYE